MCGKIVSGIPSGCFWMFLMVDVYKFHFRFFTIGSEDTMRDTFNQVA